MDRLHRAEPDLGPTVGDELEEDRPRLVAAQDAERVDRRGEQGNGRLRASGDSAGARTLVVQVEAELGRERIAQRLERPCLWCRQTLGVAIDVDARRVLALEEFGAIRIQHRNVHQRTLSQDAFRLLFAGIMQ